MKIINGYTISSGSDLKSADLSGTNLSGVDLRNADLTGANLSGANLSSANLIGANLSRACLEGADLKGACLTHADLSRANLIGADLTGANLINSHLTDANLEDANLENANLFGVNLSYANLRKACLTGAKLESANLIDACLEFANLNRVKVNHLTTGYFSVPPMEGSYIAYKKCGHYVVKLLIPDDALRSSATSRKCRASKAKVLNIEGHDKNFIASNFDPDFIYEIGKTVEVANFDTNRWNECSPGIHHFLTYEEASAW